MSPFTSENTKATSYGILQYPFFTANRGVGPRVYFPEILKRNAGFYQGAIIVYSYFITLVNAYVELVVFIRIAGTS